MYGGDQYIKSAAVSRKGGKVEVRTLPRSEATRSEMRYFGFRYEATAP